MGVRTMLIDAADTLFDLRPDLQVRLANAFAPDRVATTAAAREAILRASAAGTWPADQPGPVARLRAWSVFVGGLLRDMPDYAHLRDRFDATAQRIAADIVDPTAYAALPGAVELLSAARRRGVRCVVVSNFDHLLLDILAATGIDSLLDGVTFSGELGVGKPDRRIFDTALARTGGRREEALMVGDSVTGDVGGARRAGIDAVLFDPTDRYPWHDGPRVRHLAEVLELL